MGNKEDDGWTVYVRSRVGFFSPEEFIGGEHARPNQSRHPLTGMGDMPIVRAPSRIGFVTGESSSVPQVIEVDEVPQEEIWASLEERGALSKI